MSLERQAEAMVRRDLTTEQRHFRSTALGAAPRLIKLPEFTVMTAALAHDVPEQHRALGCVDI